MDIYSHVPSPPRAAAEAALARARRAADIDDTFTFDLGEPTEATLRCFAEVEWDEADDPRYPRQIFREAHVTLLGAQLGRVLLDREQLLVAFGSGVEALEETLSEKWTEDAKWGVA
jgi:hypothetical protein